MIPALPLPCHRPATSSHKPLIPPPSPLSPESLSSPCDRDARVLPQHSGTCESVRSHSSEPWSPQHAARASQPQYVQLLAAFCKFILQHTHEELRLFSKKSAFICHCWTPAAAPYRSIQPAESKEAPRDKPCHTSSPGSGTSLKFASLSYPNPSVLPALYAPIVHLLYLV